MNRAINYADLYERQIGEALFDAGIAFTHESEVIGQRLDFHLPEHDIYIEVKQYHTERILASRGNAQMKLDDNIILVQGKKAVQIMVELIGNLKKTVQEPKYTWPLATQTIDMNLILGEFIGTLDGICLWDIPEELKTKLIAKVAYLRQK